MRALLTFPLLVLLAACARQPVQQPPVPATPLAVAVTSDANYAADSLLAVAWTQTSVEHDAIFLQAYHAAGEQLAAALADSGRDALVPAERRNDYRALPPAIILDIDETVLDNSPYQARLIRSGSVYDDATWADWVREEAATALPGAVEFTQRADRAGVRVFYISNRDHTLDAATLANLRAAGFPVFGAEAFLGLGAELPGCTQVGTQKTCRRQLVARDYRVLMQFGDQIGDFMPITDNSLSGRASAASAHADWFGERWFMLPNPTYGSWQPALFDNDWSRSAADRHQQTIDNLRVE